MHISEIASLIRFEKLQKLMKNLSKSSKNMNLKNKKNDKIKVKWKARDDLLGSENKQEKMKFLIERETKCDKTWRDLMCN